MMIFQRLISLLLITQFTFGPLAWGQTAPSGDPDSTALTPAEHAEQREEIAELIRTLDGDGVAARLDTWRLLDQTVTAPTGPARRFRASDVRLSPLSSSNATEREIRLTVSGQTILSIKTRALVTAVQLGQFVLFIEKGTYNRETRTQHIQLLDLSKFEVALGKVKMPVFRIAVDAAAPINELRTDGTELLISNPLSTLRVPTSLIQTYSDVNELLFNAEAQALDPATVKDAAPLIDGLTTAFDQALTDAGESVGTQLAGALGSEEELKNYLDGLVAHARTTSQLAQRLSSPASGALPASLTAPAAQVTEAIASYRKQVASSRKVTARLARLVARLTLPKPMGAPSIEAGLAMLAGAFRSDRAQIAAQIREGTLSLANTPIVKRGALVTTAMLAGTLYPKQSMEFLQGTLGIGKNVFEAIYGKVVDLGSIGMASAEATFGFVQSGVLSEAFLAADKIGPFGIALTAIGITLTVTLLVPHVLVNLGYLASDAIKTDRSAFLDEKAKVGLRRALSQAFINRQNKEQANYLLALSEAEQTAQGSSEKTEWSDAQTAQLREILSDIEASEPLGTVAKMVAAFKSTKLYQRFHKASDKNKEISGFGQALGHLLFSQAAFTHFGVASAKFWNGVFAVRSFAWNPSLLFLYTLYPKFMPTAATTRGVVTLPTRFNGGALNVLSLAKRSLFNRDTLEATRAFEDAVIEAEALLHAEALKATFNAVIRYSNDPATTRALYAQGGITSLNDAALSELSWNQRMFFRNYFEDVFSRSLRSFLRSQLSDQEGLGLDEDQTINDAELKNRLVGVLQKKALSDESAQAIVSEVANEEAYQRNKPALNARAVAQTAANSFKYGVMKKLNPAKNMQVYRMQVVNTKLQEPRAVARATRSLVANFVVDKPMELALAFLLVANVSEGVLKPLHPEMFGPNSWFHMSRVVFLSGFIANTITGVAAFTWLKIQQDSGHSEELLNAVPTEDEASKGFFRYYLQKTFKNKDNTLWANQKHYLKIIMANMKSYLILALLMQIPTLGRLDVDMFINGYIVAALLPTGGLSFMLEQGFEMAVGYYARQIPPELRSHPEAVEFVLKRAQGARLKFNIYNKLFENVVGQLLLNAETLRVQGIGSRAMARWLFGGYTPTELVALGADKAKGLVAALPGVQNAIDFCAGLLTKNYTDARPEIPMPGAGDGKGK